VQNVAAEELSKLFDERKKTTFRIELSPKDRVCAIRNAYVLHLAELRWERLEIEGDAPEPRWRASSVLDPSSSQGWMFGGWQDFGVTNLNDMWRFDINAKKWIKTCSLTDEP
jgi:hypothetical protein